MRRKIMFLSSFLVLFVVILYFPFRLLNIMRIKLIFHVNGTSTTVSFLSGKSTKVPTEQYCEENKKSIVWVRDEQSSFSAGLHREKRLTVFLTDETGQTRALFDTQQLFNQVGKFAIGDLCYTLNGRIIFTAKDDVSYELMEYDINNQNFYFLYNGSVRSSISLCDNELLFTAIQGDTNEDIAISFDVMKNTYESLIMSRYAARLDEKRIIYSRNSDNALVVRDLKMNAETMIQSAPGSSFSYIKASTASLVSKSGQYAMVCYFDTKGANSEAINVGIIDLRSNKTRNLNWYFKIILLKRPPEIPLLIPGFSACEIVEE